MHKQTLRTVVPGSMRDRINQSASAGRAMKPYRNAALERYLDDLALSRMVKISQEGMKGYRA